MEQTAALSNRSLASRSNLSISKVHLKEHNLIFKAAAAPALDCNLHSELY
jgi:hypothetical protein